jgi:hypothetical protein
VARLKPRPTRSRLLYSNSRNALVTLYFAGYSEYAALGTEPGPYGSSGGSATAKTKSVVFPGSTQRIFPRERQ